MLRQYRLSYLSWKLRIWRLTEIIVLHIIGSFALWQWIYSMPNSIIGVDIVCGKHFTVIIKILYKIYILKYL